MDSKLQQIWKILTFCVGSALIAVFLYLRFHPAPVSTIAGHPLSDFVLWAAGLVFIVHLLQYRSHFIKAIVVAILLITAWSKIIGPAIEEAREKSRDFQCAMNLHEISSAFNEYSERFEDSDLKSKWLPLVARHY
jgi:hypothetical protein